MTSTSGITFGPQMETPKDAKGLTKQHINMITKLEKGVPIRPVSDDLQLRHGRRRRQALTSESLQPRLDLQTEHTTNRLTQWNEPVSHSSLCCSFLVLDGQVMFSGLKNILTFASCCYHGPHFCLIDYTTVPNFPNVTGLTRLKSDHRNSHFRAFMTLRIIYYY